ncbi:hypothetical protein [Mesorhizobium sp. M00.F.Ca.ET.217.01.1.1]|uniref:hypothetical protein n=1 Tax=Mesorhizobium sp. M00.F.Ca.ET.217.01.1.1 TaxID=2500529 RepID=UPI00167524EF
MGTDRQFSCRVGQVQSEQTDGDDEIYGFNADDRIDLTRGNDFAQGGNGNDRYIFGAGYGHDSIQDSATKRNRLQFRLSSQ